MTSTAHSSARTSDMVWGIHMQGRSSMTKPTDYFEIEVLVKGTNKMRS